MTDLKDKLSALPICFGRSVLDEILPGVVSSKSLANLAWRGVGPPFYKMGRKVYYEKSSFIEWLINRTR